MNKLSNWLSGFVKKDYVVHLKEYADVNSLNIDMMAPALVDITRTMPNLLLNSDTKLTLKSFIAKKYNNLRIRRLLLSYNKPISHIKISHVTQSKNKLMEVFMTCNIFCMGLDNNVWKFEFKASAIAASSTAEYDVKLYDVLIKYINAWIASFNLNVMCKHDVYVNMLDKYNSVYKEKFTGEVKSYSIDEEFDAFGIDNQITNMENEATLLVENLTMNDIYEETEDDSMIVDVIRKKKPNEDNNISSDELGNIFSNKSDMTVGEVIDKTEGKDFTVTRVITQREDV